MRTPEAFLEALASATGGCAAHERFICCGFAGDPFAAHTHAWRPHAWRPGAAAPIDPRRTNGYVAISTFRRAPDRTWRRRQDLFVSGRALMVDDVGTKVDPRLVQRLPPTVIVETSPGNFQWWYWLGEQARDGSGFGALIRAFIDQRLLSADPGMNGVNRVGRLPGHINGKPQHNGWRVRVTEHDCERLYTTREIALRYGLNIRRPRKRATVPRAKAFNEFAFAQALAAMKRWRMLRAREPNAAGWQEIDCPWREEHTARAGTGAAIRHPASENEWVGAFQCHHGHCVDRTWQDLEAWIAEHAAEECAAVKPFDWQELHNDRHNTGSQPGGLLARKMASANQ